MRLFLGILSGVKGKDPVNKKGNKKGTLGVWETWAYPLFVAHGLEFEGVEPGVFRFVEAKTKNHG